MACLGYFPTNVKYRGKYYARNNLILAKAKMVDALWNRVQLHIPYGFIEEMVPNCEFDELFNQFVSSKIIQLIDLGESKDHSHSPPKLNIVNDAGDLNTSYRSSNRKRIELNKDSRGTESKKGLNLDLFGKAKIIKRDIIRQKYKCYKYDRFKPDSSLHLNMDFLENTSFQL